VDFYNRQIEARRQTRWLVAAFVLAIIAVVLAVDLVLFTIFGFSQAARPLEAPVAFIQQRPNVAVFSTLTVLGIICLSSLFKALQLRQGGGVVARSLGGVRVSRDTADLKLRRLHNVVEEMSIASGVPMPEIYVLEHESGINAFAAGHTPANAAIAVTQGALDKLNRDELQGVIAHEFSHVLNGDMRLNMQLMGWLFGLFVVALIGRTLLRYAPRGRRASGGLVLAAFAVMVLGYIGLLAGRLLQAAVSRQRERLADASGVQFTRNPEGLKGALVKIAGLGEGSRIVEADAEQAAHMLFAPGVSRWFRTHPTLAERIRVLDPHFDVKRLQNAGVHALSTIPAFTDAELMEAQVANAGALRAAAASTTPILKQTITGAVPASPPAADEAAPSRQAAPVPLHLVADQVGTVTTVHIQHAGALRVALPDSICAFAESGARARAVVLALLISRDETIRASQLAMLEKALPAADLGIVQDTLPIAQGLDPMLRLPALQQVFPALRRLPIAERQGLAKLADRLIRSDARIDVFEFCLARLLATLLRDEIEARVPHGNVSLADAQADIHTVFAVLARFGARDERQARMAYEAGMHLVLPMHRPPYAVIEDWPPKLAEALQRLEKLHPFAKRALIDGLAKTVAHDGQLNVHEAELLRTVCAILHCPLPLLE